MDSASSFDSSTYLEWRQRERDRSSGVRERESRAKRWVEGAHGVMDAKLN